MKILFFSDLHNHNYQEFAEVDDSGLNSRLSAGLQAVAMVQESAIEHEVDYVCFGGDVLHLKNFADIQVVRWTIDAFRRFNQIAPVFMCAGNHDYRNWNRDPVLVEALSDFDDNIQFVEVAELNDGWNLFVFNYRRNISELADILEKWKYDEKSIGLFHQDLIGSQYGGVINRFGLDPLTLQSKFRWSFVGHFHNPKVYGQNVISIGSPLAHNFGDTGIEHGWWILDTEKNAVEFVQNDLSPKFIDWEVRGKADVFTGRPDIDYYRVKAHGQELPESLNTLKWKRVSVITENDKKQRADLKFSDTGEEIISKYVTAKNPNLDTDKLIEMGRRYL